MLESNSVEAAAKLFAATTLKGKVGHARHFGVPSLTKADRIRPSPSAPRVTSDPTRNSHEKLGDLPLWA